jgi:hypothetical protein
MAAVSPWFFTHYGPDSWNKNWVYRSDNWLFNSRWEQLIAHRHDIDIVQIISWNGRGELLRTCRARVLTAPSQITAKATTSGRSKARSQTRTCGWTAFPTSVRPALPQSSTRLTQLC